MNKPDNHILTQDIIKEAEAIIVSRTECTTELKERLLTCPAQWTQVIKNFIKKFDDNIT